MHPPRQTFKCECVIHDVKILIAAATAASDAASTGRALARKIDVLGHRRRDLIPVRIHFVARERAALPRLDLRASGKAERAEHEQGGEKSRFHGVSFRSWSIS